MKNERKVIPFTKPFKKNLVRTSINDVRAAATGTIAFILLMMVGFNFQMFQGSNVTEANATQSQRGLASVPKVLAPQWKKSLSELGQKEMVQKASRPSAIDSLTYGYLKGNYSFTVEKGAVKSIHFSNASEAQPQVVGDRQKFINDHASAIAPDLQSISSAQREVSEKGVREIYNLKTSTATKTVVFELDKNNGLIGIAVQ